MKYDFEADYEFITRSESSKIQYEEEQNILVQQCQRSEKCMNDNSWITSQRAWSLLLE